MIRYLGLCLLLISHTALSAAPPQRIIALSPHAVEMLFAIGVGDRIVATTEYADYPAQALAIPRIGGYHGIQLDRVIELQPDLIVVWRDGNQPGDIEQLQRLGYPLYQSQPANLEAIADELEELGRRVGEPQQAHLAAAEFRQRLARLRTRYQAQPAISVFYQLWGNPLMSVSKQSWIHQMIDSCGGVNVMADASTAYPQVSLEQVLMRRPEVIIRPDDHGNQSASSYDWRPWQELPAVAHQQIYAIDGDLLHRFSPRALDGLQQLCEVLMQARQNYKVSE